MISRIVCVAHDGAMIYRQACRPPLERPLGGNEKAHRSRGTNGITRSDQPRARAHRTLHHRPIFASLPAVR